MNTHTNKTQENKSQSVGNGVYHVQSNGESAFQFVDNRIETVAQRKLQTVVNNSSKVSQLRSFQREACDIREVKSTKVEDQNRVNKKGLDPIQKVLMRGRDLKAIDDKDGSWEAIFKNDLNIIISVQGAMAGGWQQLTDGINQKLQALPSNVIPPELEKEIADLYTEFATVNFQHNSVLNEAWSRCVDATKDWKSYTKVGGKFKDKFDGVLNEIVVDFPNLQALAKGVVAPKVNKEHMVNKGGAHQGAQTDHVNLMHAGVPPTGSKASLSELHKALHALKSGSGSVNYSALHPQIRKIIEDAQASEEYKEQVFKEHKI